MLVSTDIALDRLRALPRGQLGSWPTRLEARSTLGGRPLWVKRDDLSALGRGGAKARKIDLLLGHLTVGGYDELVTIAGNITNLAFDLLPVLAAARIHASLLIMDDPPLAQRERERIFAGVLDGVRLIGRSRVAAAAAALAACVAARRAGRRPFLLAPGASHPTGVLGSALGFLEMASQLEAIGEPLPAAVVVTAATGTTLAGFLLGEHLLRASGRPAVRIVGVEAYGGDTARRTLGLLRWSERALGLRDGVPARRIETDRSALAGGFGRTTRAQWALCECVGERLGLAIDPVFGGKSWSVLERRSAELARSDRPLLYWHCGFTPEWRSLCAAAGEG